MHLRLNVSSFALDCGYMVNGGVVTAAIGVLLYLNYYHSAGNIMCVCVIAINTVYVTCYTFA